MVMACCRWCQVLTQVYFPGQGLPDATDQYIAVMNAIFAAQARLLRPSCLRNEVS